jgi:hypothetical protein
MSRSGLFLAILFSLTVPTAASAAVHIGGPIFPAHVDPEASQVAPTAPTPLGNDEILDQYGFEPGSEKARTILRWVHKIRTDPAIAANLPGGADNVGDVFLDPEKRQDLMTDGLALLDAADRRHYVELISRLLDELVPVNCYGMSDMSAVMTRVRLQDMSNADVDLYLGLLYKVVARYASGAPIHMPTRDQSSAGQARLSWGIAKELQGDIGNMDRYAYYAEHPAAATPADICWMTRVTMHAIVAMPDRERDYVLLPSITDRDDATHSQTSSPAAVLPASATPQVRAP